LTGVLSYEDSGSLDSFFAKYLSDSDMNFVRKNPKRNTFYANICLVANVYVGWYQYILTLLPQASTIQNFPLTPFT
jgi:hypothetical protein